MSEYIKKSAVLSEIIDANMHDFELSSRYIGDYWSRPSYPYSWIFRTSPNYYFDNYECFSKARIPTYSTIDMSVYVNTACSWYYYTRR